MSNFVINSLSERSEVFNAINTVTKEYYSSFSDFMKVKDALLRSLDEVFASNGVVFNQRRLLKFFSGYMRDLLVDRRVGYEARFEGKPVKKNEVVTFSGKFNDITLYIHIKKVHKFDSDFKAVIIDSTNENPLYTLTNEYAVDYINNYRIYLVKADEIVDKFVEAVGKETEYFNIHRLCENIREVLESIFNMRVFSHNDQRLLNIIKSLLDATKCNCTDPLFKNMELGFDSDEKKVKISLIY